SEEKEVVAGDQGDLDVSTPRDDLLQLERGVDTAEAASEDENATRCGHDRSDASEAPRVAAPRPTTSSVRFRCRARGSGFVRLRRRQVEGPRQRESMPIAASVSSIASVCASVRQLLQLRSSARATARYRRYGAAAGG